MFLISFKDNRFLGCTKRCGYTHSVPKTGKLTLLDKTCETCGWKMFSLKEEGEAAPEENLCINRRCKEGRQYWRNAGSVTSPTVGSRTGSTTNAGAKKVSKISGAGRKENS
jgi:DNA topoisomerase-1